MQYFETIEGLLHYCGQPVKWTGAPERQGPGSEHLVKIKRELSLAEEKPQLGDMVRVQGKSEAEFIAPIIAIHKVTRTAVHAVTDSPPWANESFGARRVREGLDVLKEARRVAVRESLGLCIICGEDPQVCGCVEAAERHARERKEARSTAVTAEEQRKLIERRKLHNERAMERRANLTVEEVKGAIIRNQGDWRSIGVDLGIDKYFEETFLPASGHGLETVKPRSAGPFLAPWCKRNAPELDVLAARLRAEAARKNKSAAKRTNEGAIGGGHAATKPKQRKEM